MATYIVARLCHLWHRHAILRRGVAHAMEKCHMENQGHQKHFGNSADLSSFVMSGWPSSSWSQSTRAQTHRMTSLRPAAVPTLPATDAKKPPPCAGIDASTTAGRFFFHVDVLPALSLRLPFFEREVRGFHQDSQKVDLRPSRTTTCALRDVC